MFGPVRCVCGRFMKFTGAERATYSSGRRQDYSCRRCGATAHIWSNAGVDDEPIGGLIKRYDEEEDRIVYYEPAWEWRPERQSKSGFNPLTEMAVSDAPYPPRASELAGEGG
jgi:hypothetical protein